MVVPVHVALNWWGPHTVAADAHWQQLVYCRPAPHTLPTDLHMKYPTGQDVTKPLEVTTAPGGRYP